MEKKIIHKNRFTVMDGGMGTMLQKAGLEPGMRPELMCFTAPEKVTEIHRMYVEAGSDIICANTFGANPKKLMGSGYTTQQVITAAINCAKKACTGTETLVALDIGSLGELLEPAGLLPFEEAYKLFTQVMLAGQQAGADLILVETISDLYEMKAALLAARENTNLPVLASMTFEKTGRTFTGVPVEAMGATLTGLGAAALGINCSLGPAGLMPLAKRLCSSTPLPVFMKPNAGLPDTATGRYTLTPESFCQEMEPCIQMGISMVGGCCGTTPETIASLSRCFKQHKPATKIYHPKAEVCSATKVVEINKVTPVGERINPTGKKWVQEALKAGDMAPLQALAVEQEKAGALLININVGTPGIDEVTILPQAIKAVQAVTSLPVGIDSANIQALAAALRVCNGKPMVNSTSGEQKKLEAILPLCKEYGASVIGLTLDEEGIPDTSAGRLAIAKRILDAALQLGIPKEDVWIDCLTMAVSAEPNSADITLGAVKLVHEELGLKTILGASNISFGLPNRPLLNRAFVTMALGMGLDLPIINPSDGEMMGAIACGNLLRGLDAGAEAYIANAAKMEGETARNGVGSSPNTAGEKHLLYDAIVGGLKDKAGKATEELLAEGQDGMKAVDQYLMPALDEVGRQFEKGSMFLPQLLASANAAQVAFEKIRAFYGKVGSDGPPVVVATVQGDVHDIGKNIAKVLLENYGYRVIDLGRDVPPEKVVEAVKQSGAKLVGLSALMTTTLPSMKETIDALHAQGLPCKVMAGGAVLTEEYALEIGADFYARDAQRSIEIAREIYGK